MLKFLDMTISREKFWEKSVDKVNKDLTWRFHGIFGEWNKRSKFTEKGVRTSQSLNFRNYGRHICCQSMNFRQVFLANDSYKSHKNSMTGIELSMANSMEYFLRLDNGNNLLKITFSAQELRCGPTWLSFRWSTEEWPKYSERSSGFL